MDGSVNVWDDGYPSSGNYWSDYTETDFYRGPHQNVSGSDGIGDTPYVINDENQDSYPLMKPHPWVSHAIGIANVMVSRTAVAPGQNITASSTIFNYGSYAESFNVTVYLNGTVIGFFEHVTLASGNSTTLNVLWNTTDFAKGSYAIDVQATQVLGEMDIYDNTATVWTLVTIPGDVDGDRDNDIFDIVSIAQNYGRPPPPLVNLNCDIDGDGDADIFDLVTAAGHYGESW